MASANALDNLVDDGADTSDADHLQALLASMPQAFQDLVSIDAVLHDAWFRGVKIGRSKNQSPRAKDAALASYLARRLTDVDLKPVLRAYPHGESYRLKGVHADKRVVKLLEMAEKVRSTASAKTDVPKWWWGLKATDRGDPRDCVANVAVVLRNDRAFIGKIRLDELSNSAVSKGMPWQAGTEWEDWTDADDLRLADWLQTRDVPVKVTTVAAGVQLVAAENPFHPVREYLNAQKWDETKRLDTWLIDYLGVADTPYARTVGRKTLIAGIARVRNPGCKVDNCLILEGPQDLGKSMIAEAIAIKPIWFTDSVSDLGTKDAAQDLRGKWIIELAELSAMKKADVEPMKAFMTRRIDHYRPSYGRRSQDFPRQCIFVGSTNQDHYFHDETGNRRFWPVKVTRIDVDGLKTVMPQLWAEADLAYRSGEPWWLSNDEKIDAKEEQEARRVGDPWQDAVLEWANRQFSSKVRISDVLLDAVEMDRDRQDQHAQKRVAAILRGAGWVRDRVRIGTWSGWGYIRPEGDPS